MAYKQYGNVVNTLNIKAKNIFNWNTNYPDTYGYTNLNAVNAHTIIKRSGIRIATGTGALLGFVPSLIGLNFDRVWEGTMSDIYYSPEICRNIMVDIRYVLFIIDKFAGADNLINELKIINPKKKM